MTPLREKRWAFGFAVAFGAPLLLSGCTTRDIVAVDIGVVTAYPSTASLVDGQNLRFTATVTDVDGRPLQGATVTWETDDEEVALIDETGLLLALREGTTTVRASFREAYGTAFVTVLPDAALRVSQDSVVFYAAAAGESPVPTMILVSVNGFGSIGGLEASVRFAPDQPDGWLVPILADTATPTSLTLTPATSALPAGAYDATVVLDSSDDHDPVQISVSLFVSGFTVTQSGGSTSVTESGGTDSLSVVLDAKPRSDVVLDVTSGDPSEVSVSPTRLTFTPSTWDAPQTVIVTGQDDSIRDGDATTAVTVSVVDALSDPAFSPVPDQIVAVTTIDDEVAGFVVTETAGSTSVTESGGTDSFTVVLETRPDSDVVIDVLSHDLSEVTVAPGRLTFKPSNWNVAQTVTLTGKDDVIADGNITTQVTVTVVDALSDPVFGAAPDQIVLVTTVDDEVAGFTVQETGGSTLVREGRRDELKVVLNAQPLSSVVIRITSADPDYVAVSPTTLTFTPGNWAKSQTVSVLGLENDDFDGIRLIDVILGVDAALSDDAFDSVPDQVIRVRFFD
jgi:hypothetical protein